MADGLGPGPSWRGTILQALFIMRLSNWIAMASTFLVLYDIILTLPAEIEYIWLAPARPLPTPAPSPVMSTSTTRPSPLSRLLTTIRQRRPTFPTFLYFLNRYGTLIQSALCNVANLDPALQGEECMRWTWFNNWTVPLGMLVVEAMLVLRVSALYLNARSILLPLWLLWLLTLLLSSLFLLFGLLHTFPIPPIAPQITGCLLGGTQRLFWAVWLPSLGLESVLFGMSVVGVWGYVKEGASTSVLRVLARDGILYFVVIFFLLLTNVLVPLLSTMPYYSVAVELTLCITSILCSRMYLNIRRCAHHKRVKSKVGSNEREQTFVREWTIDPEHLEVIEEEDEEGDEEEEGCVRKGDEERQVDAQREKAAFQLDVQGLGFSRPPSGQSSLSDASSAWSRSEEGWGDSSRSGQTSPSQSTYSGSHAVAGRNAVGRKDMVPGGQLGRGEWGRREREWFERSWGTVDSAS